jgi:RHS repeat-associated protein
VGSPDVAKNTGRPRLARRWCRHNGQTETSETDWNAQGYVSETQVQKPGASSMSRFVTINAEADPTLRPTQFTSGDGVVSNWSFDPTTGLPTTIESTATSGSDLQKYIYGYDNLGNVTSRQTRSANVPWYNTSYSYDALNRLTQNVDSRDTGYAQAYEYDAIGNMTWRSDLGKMNYGQGSAGPHQLSSVTVDPASPYLSTLSTGPLKSYAHTSFNRVASVTLGNNSTPTLEYGYDETHQRVRQMLQTPAGVITSTIYYFRGPGVMLEEQVNGDGSIEWHDYIGTAAGLAGEYWSSNESGAPAPKTLYFYGDAQGTISAISGSTSEQDSYDPFGKQQNTNGSSDATCSLPSGDAQSRGWIGEEKLPSGCLVNLNARLYDPLTAHFLGADSKVGQPFSTQGWNRYSYAGNNPMTFTDPTGMCFLGCFWKSAIFRDVAGLAVAVALNVWALPAVLDGGVAVADLSAGQLAVNAGIAGAASGAVSTGTLKGVVLSAASALAFSGVGDIVKADGFTAGGWQSVALHGVAGGLISVAQGGKFQSGFLAAGFAELAGPALEIPGNSAGAVAANTAVNAAIGGIGSVLGGGKFENGAITGAFGYLFNKLSHSYLDQNGRISKFYDTNYDAVVAVAIKLGVDPTVLLGIAALESGWGTSTYATQYNDPFGATPHGDSSGALAYPSIGDAWGQWQSDWGSRIQGLGGNVSAILNALEEDNRGLNGQGVPGAVDSRGEYNSENPNWKGTVTTVIGNVRDTLPMWQGNLDSKP